MSSIVLSFVGNQDPYSGNTKEEGSIVTLVRHLMGENNVINQIILLYTQDNQPKAQFTKEWLNEELNIDGEKIELSLVSEDLSNDPINVILIIKEVKKCLSKVLGNKKSNDIIEFNGSSGTPGMKTAWGVIQAVSYGFKNRLWQVRNPKEMRANQGRVFENNLNVFKLESDLKLIKKQLQNYNYNGALQTLENSDFNSEIATGLIKYAYYRLAFNFDQAFEAIRLITDKIDPNWNSNIIKLRQKDSISILQDVYYKAQIQLNNKQYADFLIQVFCFQENVLRHLVKTMLLKPKDINKSWHELQKERIIKKEIELYDDKKLLSYLNNYKYNGRPLIIDFERYFTRPIFTAIIEYNPEYKELVSSIDELETYCTQRNDYIHNLTGVPEIPQTESDHIMKNLREILSKINPNFSRENPFHSINEQILKHLQ